MKERFFNLLWKLGIKVRNTLKRIGLLGIFEPILAYFGPRLLPPLSEEVEVVLTSDLRMCIPPNSPSARNYITGEYEWELSNLFKKLLKVNMSIVDAGTYIGYYTLLASRLVGTKGCVYAFEPHPQNYECLMKNISLNNCTNVTTIPIAIGNKSGEVNLITEKVPERSWLSNREQNKTDSLVRTITLDEFFAKEGWPPVDLIKMDIEGGEKAALEGMKELSERNPNLQLIMEYALDSIHRARTSPEALADILQRLGFKCGYIIERGMKPVPLSSGLPKTRAVYNLLLKKE